MTYKKKANPQVNKSKKKLIDVPTIAPATTTPQLYTWVASDGTKVSAAINADKKERSITIDRNGDITSITANAARSLGHKAYHNANGSETAKEWGKILSSAAEFSKSTKSIEE